MLLVRTTLAPSAIHGYGLFADERIPNGTLIWEFTPNFDLVFESNALNELPIVAMNLIKHYAYKSLKDQKYVLCCDNARFTNHSEYPNTIHDQDIKGQVIAAKDIEIGEEITTNYKVFDADFARKLIDGFLKMS